MTADSTAKIAVADIDGNGTPDAVVTSKFGMTLSVIATTTNAFVDKSGDIMADYTTPGGKIFPVGNDNEWVFEHEVGIADIDKDGVSEIYAIASRRGSGNSGGNNPPS